MSSYQTLISTSDDDLIQLFAVHGNISAVCRTFGLKIACSRSRAFLRSFIDRHQLTESHRTKHDAAIVDAVAQAKCISDVLRNLDLPTHGANHKTVQRLIDEKGLSTDHFDADAVRARGKSTYAYEDIFCVDSKYSRSALSATVQRLGVLKYQCVWCKNEGEWLGEPMSLVIDHINGINNDNRVDNLRYLCYNCHSITPTFAGRNVKHRSVG